MDKLMLMEIFVRIVETGSFSAVARETGMTQPTYLERREVPQHPTELTKHHCLHYIHRSTGNECVYPAPGGEIRVRIAARFRSNNGYALRDAMLARHGIAVMPLVLIQEELSRGAAVPVLQEYTSRPLPVNAVYPSDRFLSAKVRFFVGYLQERLPRIPGMVAP